MTPTRLIQFGLMLTFGICVPVALYGLLLGSSLQAIATAVGFVAWAIWFAVFLLWFSWQPRQAKPDHENVNSKGFG